MIKTIIKLLLVLAVLNAAAHAGAIAWRYYRFKDEAYELILFGAKAPTEQLREEILSRAIARLVPIERENIQVRREGNQTFADAAYTEPLEYLPTLNYPVDLSFSVDAFVTAPPPREERAR